MAPATVAALLGHPRGSCSDSHCCPTGFHLLQMCDGVLRQASGDKGGIGAKEREVAGGKDKKKSTSAGSWSPKMMPAAEAVLIIKPP